MKQIKVAFLGDSAVGKTSLIQRIVTNYFQEQQQTTTGYGCTTYNYTQNGQNIRLQLWDTAGQEQYRSLAPSLYKNSNVIITVVDLSTKTTLEGCKYWLHEVSRNCVNEPTIIIAGNKCDLSSREVDDVVIQKISKDYEALYCECSAKTGQGIEEILSLIANNVKVVSQNNQLNMKDTKKEKSCC